MSGIEVAGLVLGAIPLILAGLQFYGEGINVTKRYAKYSLEISSLLVELRAENTLYINSINMLLIGVVDQKDMAVFLADPSGARWKEQKFDRNLRTRLGTSYTSYLEAINQLKVTADLFKERLKLDSAGKVQFSDKNAFKEHYRRLKFSLNKNDYKDLMDQLRVANQRIYRLTIQTSHLAAHQVPAKSDQPSAPNFRVIKDRAESFYSVLSEAWTCPCHADHSVSLRLETRMDDVPSDDEDEEGSMRDPFHVLFRYNHTLPLNAKSKPWIWEEADVRIEQERQCPSATPAVGPQVGKGVRFATQAIPKAVQAALEPEPNLQPIKDLCSAISTLQKPQRDVCFSLLAKEIAKQKYGVRITPIKQLPLDTESWSVSSLGSVLRDPKFAQRDRLRLAVTLASSILQLHETPWLEDQWSKDSIFFVNRPGKTLYDQPFVSQHFNQTMTGATSGMPNHMSCIIRNQTLYALGVALIELWYRKPIAELHETMDGPQNTGNDMLDLMTQFRTADRLSETLYDEAGAKYSDAVRRCIRCDFDRRASSLEDVQFQKAVYQGVVAQLQANYDYLFHDDTD